MGLQRLYWVLSIGELPKVQVEAAQSASLVFHDAHRALRSHRLL